MTNSTRFNTIFQLASVFALLMMEVACVSKPPLANAPKSNDDSLMASRAGGCPEGKPCRRSNKPRASGPSSLELGAVAGMGLSTLLGGGFLMGGVVDDLFPKPSYYQYITQGRSALNSGKTTQAIENFKQALQVAGSDAAKQQEAYGNLGLAYEAASDNPTAQAYLERAGAKEQAPAWIKDGYKNLLSSQKIMTVEYKERKLQAENEIEQEEAQLQAAYEESSGSERRGSIDNWTVGAKAMNTPDDDRPKPLKKIHPGPTPVARTHVDIPSAETALDIRINFSVDSAELTPEGQKQADEIGKLLQQKLQGSDQVVVLVGHTDMLGSEEYNDHLSEERANAVKTYLISKFPDLKGKLTGRGMGKRQPIFKEMDEESQRLNRRVEVKLSRSTE